MLSFEQSLVGRKILITGHTGFTGSWACLWLASIGAKVAGFALAPETNPSLYSELALDDEIDSTIADIRSIDDIGQTIARIKPEAILHLAAQQRLYREPIRSKPCH